MKVRSTFFILVLLLLAGCTAIKLTEQGKNVRVVGRYDVAACKTIGTTTATVTDKVAGLKRKEHIVKKDLETLARNAAVSMGGDTIVPQGEIEGGKQTFKVFKCLGR